MNKIILKREVRSSTRTYMAEAHFTPLSDGGVAFDIFTTEHDGSNPMMAAGTKVMTDEQARNLRESFLNEREVVGRSPWITSVA